jgi:Flp pilus assembly protein TadG
MRHGMPSPRPYTGDGHPDRALLASRLSHSILVNRLRSHISKLRHRSPHGSESGVALVEFVLVVPVLLLLVLGMVEFGKGFNYWIDETHLANEAARFAVVNKDPGSGTLQDYILSQGDTSELRTGGTTSVPGKPQVCISFPSGTSNVGDPVKATVTLTYHWLPILQRVADTPISASATMRLEARPTNYSAGCSS